MDKIVEDFLGVMHSIEKRLSEKPTRTPEEEELLAFSQRKQTEFHARFGTVKTEDVV